MKRPVPIVFLWFACAVTGVLIVRRTAGAESPPPSHVRANADGFSGQTTTLLPDGHRLELGGNGPDGPTAVARSGTAVLPAQMHFARAWQTATMLPTGQVLILGGIGRDGEVVRVPALFDPVTMTFTVLADGPTPRAFHTATVLLDGTVVIAGGIGEPSVPLLSIERWDSRTRARDEVPLPCARMNHTASLLPDGEIMLWGGVDAAGKRLAV